MRQNLIYAYSSARSLSFTLQSLSLPLWELLVTGKLKDISPTFLQNLKRAQIDLHRLLKEDAKNIATGFYPLKVLQPESPSKFVRRYPQIIADGAGLARRRLKSESKQFNAEAHEYFQDVPDYFQRNFHFQTGGYLTEKSAELYEHQVEILFAGAADAMRRMLIRPMKEHFPMSQGEGLHFLEIGAGTGRLTRFIKLAFPKARITLLDLSYPYLKQAQKRLEEFSRLDFIQGDGARLSFADNNFDGVFSCFLFHELPHEVRRRVVAESHRVLKEGGFFGLVDALQENDKSNFNWALEQFPVDFHEPFFKNYIKNSMEGLCQAQNFAEVQTQYGFLSKVVSGKKV